MINQSIQLKIKKYNDKTNKTIKYNQNQSIQLKIQKYNGNNGKTIKSIENINSFIIITLKY